MSNELFRRMKLKTKLTIYPLKRALFYLESGEVDGVMILIKTPEREKYLLFTNSIIDVRGFIWSAADRKEGAVEFDSIGDLKRYKAGVTLGYSYGREFDAVLKEMDIEEAPGDYNNYRKLLNHRIDIFPGNEIVAKALFKKHSELQGKLIHSEKAFIEWNLRMGISKKSALASRITEINGILSQMKTERIVESTVKKYTE